VKEAQRACEQLSLPSGHEAIGAAYYRRAELHRLLGEFAEAEEDYRRASERGASPQPGLALMRLAQGQVPAAAAAIRRETEEANDPPTRARLLPAQVEIMLAAGDAASARTVAEELAGLAGVLDAPLLRAASAHAMGSVLLAEADPRAALGSLRQSLAAWRSLEAPYEAARARVLIGLACRELADEDSAQMELEGARRTFQDLGAKRDLAAVEALLAPPAPATAGGLTAREIEVLRLVAAGKSNRTIASELVISEKTVARHVSNIFTKLGLSSRAAATAYAYQHEGQAASAQVVLGRQTGLTATDDHGLEPLHLTVLGHLGFSFRRRLGRKEPYARGIRRHIGETMPMLEDGRVLGVANVIWCTGFREDFSWIDLRALDDHGKPKHRRGIVADEPGLYFVGLKFQYAVSSDIISGVGRDAEYVVKHIASREQTERSRIEAEAMASGS
jgi:DNA-binding NarL/FixJ family response regulator